MVIGVEGPKNVGKTFLLGKSKFSTYKFPFIPYYKAQMAVKPEDTGEGSKEAFHFTTAFDVTLFSMIESKALIGFPLLVDRSFLSNVVLGELQSRITHEEGCRYIDWLAEQGYLENFTVVYIDKKKPEDGRSNNKDDWEYLGYEEQQAKFEQYFKYLEEKHGWKPVRFVNAMNKEEIARFERTVTEIQLTRSKENVKVAVKSGLDFLKDAFGEMIDDL